MNNDASFTYDGSEPAKPKVIDGGQTHECPACGVGIFGITRIGDASICIACRALITLDVEYDIMCRGDGAKWAVITRSYLRYPTEAEEKVWLADPRVLNAIRTVATHHERHGSPHPNLNPPDHWKGTAEQWRRHLGDGGEHPPY